ncbi:MAG: IgGFc-binding protein [Myxococcales bacterium]|nr:IgGFc-binding protein [Myxococcales bacterium]
MKLGKSPAKSWALAGVVVLGACGAVLSACASTDDDLGADRAGGPKIDFCATGGDGFACEGAQAVDCADKTHRVDCAAIGKTCHEGVGCVTCTPGAGSCENGQASVCRPDGAGYLSYQCDEKQGMTCTPGGCVGACSWGALGSSYLGCDYYPTVTLNNGVWDGFEFAVVVSNVGKVAANVLITRGTDEIRSLVLEPGKLETLRLPWVKELKGPDPNFMGQPQPPGTSSLVKGGAYRVRSDQPIAAYQFNPLDYQLEPRPSDCPKGPSGDGCYSYSNDASLLLPAHALRERYTVSTWPTLGCKPAFFTITATADDTEVQLTPRGDLAPGGGFDSSGQGYAKLSRGDVLQMIGMSTGGPFCFDSAGSDVTGSVVVASKPVQVIAGNGCANIPAPETQACDHVEEVMFPDETLGHEYVVAPPATPSGPNPDAQQTLRIVAIEEGTDVLFDPPSVHLPVVLGPSSPPLEIRYLRDNVRIKAGKPIIVAQFMQGTDKNGDDGVGGDPAQSMAIPTGQYRNEYTFLAPESYASSWVDVIARVGQTVRVDEQVVSNFTAIGESGWGIAHVKLGPGSVHQASGAKTFGITVYGYGDWTSYMYPGGLNLGTINPTVK